jgi:hypothetical protein
MLQAATSETIAPCPKCRQEMVLAVIIPAAPPLARHTYLCGNCNQTKTYILPVGPAVDEVGGDPDRPAGPALVEHHPGRAEPRYKLATPATIYAKDGSLLFPCTIRDLSKSGARLELLNEVVLPQYFFVSMLPDGSSRRLCSKVWQVVTVAGVRFVEKQPG